MNLNETLRRLCLVSGAPGQSEAAVLAATLLSPYCDRVEQDAMGNVIGYRRGSGEGPLIVLEAHIDQIGMTVTAVEEDGRLQVDALGGIDPRVLSGTPVTVYGDAPYEGICAPATDKVTPVKERLVDVFLAQEEAAAHIAPGAPVNYRPHYTTLACHRVSATSLDDRCGVAAVLRCLDMLQEIPLPCRVAVVFSVREEVGLAGAGPAAYTLQPDAALCVDVSFAAMPQENVHECGKLGEGPMIGIAPGLDYAITERLLALAKEQGIPFQREVMDGHTGTDADAIGISRYGVRTALLSIPQRYMHTPVEVIDLLDVEQTARLMAAFLQEGWSA